MARETPAARVAALTKLIQSEKRKTDVRTRNSTLSNAPRLQEIVAHIVVWLADDVKAAAAAAKAASKQEGLVKYVLVLTVSALQLHLQLTPSLSRRAAILKMSRAGDVACFAARLSSPFLQLWQSSRAPNQGLSLTRGVPQRLAGCWVQS